MLIGYCNYPGIWPTYLDLIADWIRLGWVGLGWIGLDWICLLSVKIELHLEKYPAYFGVCVWTILIIFKNRLGQKYRCISDTDATEQSNNFYILFVIVDCAYLKLQFWRPNTNMEISSLLNSSKSFIPFQVLIGGFSSFRPFGMPPCMASLRHLRISHRLLNYGNDVHWNSNLDQFRSTHLNRFRYRH